MIRFAHPEALFLLPLWAFALWRFRGAGLHRPLRVAVFLCVLLAWLDPALNRVTPGLDLWMLADHSQSAEQHVQPRIREMGQLLEESKGPHDRLFRVDFADEAIVHDELAAAILPGRRDATAIGNALQHTLSRLRPNRNARILLVSDGFATDAIDQAGQRLLHEHVPLDLRLMGGRPELDVRVDEFNAPMRVRPGEPFLVEASLVGPAERRVTVSLHRDGAMTRTRTFRLAEGPNRLQWTGRIDQAGASRFEIRVEAPDDPYPGNNRQAQWIESAGGRRILLLTAYPDDPIAPLLRDAGFETRVVTDPAGLDAGDLSGTAAVWIHNVWAADVPRAFMEALPFFVREQGGGLVMAGGKAAFGGGGYFDSPIDPLLPVSMELKEEDRRLTVAMGIVMDRSGSMGASVGGGTKMDLANSGAARAIELLGPMDGVTVFAVDTEAHTIVPLSQVGNDRGGLLDTVRRIQSSGGGIFVFNGLDAAWKELKNAPQTHRHIILFSDAADSEQPQGVDRLIREMTANQTTVSVIALGTENDPDAPFLEQIAEDGQGRIFYNQDPGTLPEVFAQETVTVSRSAFIDEPVGVDPVAGWSELAAAPLDWPETVDGYNLSYLRGDATESLRTRDEYEAPLLAHWRRGAGRVAAVSFPMGGEHSATFRAWPQAGDFIRTLARWVLRPGLEPGLALRVRREGETVRLHLYADTEWQERFAQDPPRLRARSSLEGREMDLPWRRVRPGLLQTDVSVAASERLLGALRIGDQVMPFGPVSGVLGAEWRFDRAPLDQLLALSTASGGINRLDLSGIWEHPPRPRWRGTAAWWLWTAFLLFLAEALWARVGRQRIQWEWETGKRLREKKRSRRERPAKPEPAPRASPEPEAPRRRAAFQQARHRSRR
jgi:uncharacterized membrane protein